LPAFFDNQRLYVREYNHYGSSDKMDIESIDRELNWSPDDSPGLAEVVWIYISPILSNKYALLGSEFP
jgi:hypothetical protein